MGIRDSVRRAWAAVYRWLSSGDDDHGLGAANPSEERARLFDVMDGGGGHGGFGGSTPPSGPPPHNLRGSRPDRDEE